MQKPDADGYVHINWPSKSIPHGGIFHTRRVEPTAHQQQFLKLLLEESKLSIAQRKKTDYMLRQEEEKKPEPPVQMPLVRPRTSKRRSLSAIRVSGIYDDEPFKPLKRGEDREKMKDKLAHTMAYGPGPDQTPPPPPRIPKPKPKVPTAKEKWNDLLTQIRERAEWLAEMEDLGQADPHREIIQEQIAERLRALDALGIDSECSSVRSGFSTMRSVEPQTVRSGASLQSKGSAKSNRTIKSNKSSAKGEQPIRSAAGSIEIVGKKTIPGSGRSRDKKKEENVKSYQCSLQYSPRRRV